MQKFYLCILLLGCLSVVRAQNKGSVSTPPEVLTIKEFRYDFGRIPLGKPVTHTFEVFNTGKEPLQIENVHASCGCTTPEWSQDPIAPGASKKIKVGYNAAVNGAFEKTITVFYNSGKMKVLYIKGEVWETPAEPAPANASIQLLKNINH